MFYFSSLQGRGDEEKGKGKGGEGIGKGEEEKGLRVKFLHKAIFLAIPTMSQLSAKTPAVSHIQQLPRRRQTTTTTL